MQYANYKEKIKDTLTKKSLIPIHGTYVINIATDLPKDFTINKAQLRLGWGKR